MASLDILCSDSLNLENKITKIDIKKIFCGPSKMLKNVSWPINICLKCFMTPTKTLHPPPLPRTPSYILSIRSLIRNKQCFTVGKISFNNLLWQQVSPFHSLCLKPIWTEVKSTLNVSHSQQIFLLPLLTVSVTTTHSLN